MAWAHVVSVGAGELAGQSSITTAAVDTSGANTLFAVVAADEADAVPTLSDSKGNTWVALTARNNPGGGNISEQITYYAKNATVGAGHTFTANSGGASVHTGISVSAFSGGDTTAPFDVENGNTGIGTGGVSTGSITPSEANTLVIATLGFYFTPATISIDNGFTIGNQNDFSAVENNHGTCIAYKIQGAAAAVNPAFTTGGSNCYLVAEIASFKEGAGGGGSTAKNLTLLGVG
jgi:hypothetical protein